MNFEEMSKEGLIEYIKNLNESNNGKYGLIWDKEKEPEQVVVDCDKNIPVLEEVKEKEIDNGGEDNILIEGDNFHALSVLNYTHSESIDVIYIDPPYNTGNKDFIYNDKYVDIEDGYRHSKWLNFMSKRLKLAKNLLRDNGVIFISIDDNEQAQLKLLCDSVFSEVNFIANIVWKRKRGRDNSARWFSKAHEYCLVYAKNKYNFDINKIKIDEEGETRKQYKNPDNDPEGDYRKLGVWARGNQSGVKYSFVMSDGYEFSERLWLMSKDNLKKLDEEKKLIRVGDKLYRKFYIKEHKGQVPETIWDDVSNSANASDLIKKMFNGKIVFDTAKPVEYIKKIIEIASNKNSLILDFFAGSGTTAQAVLELNKEDGGNRKFILCTNNENNICENVTYPRIKTVITGKRTDGSKYSDGLEGSLRYFKTDFVKNEGTRDQLYYDLTEKCVPMLCVKEGTFDVIIKNEQYAIYTNKDKGKYTCVYFDTFGNKYDEFLDKVEGLKNEKVLYIFSLGNKIEEPRLEKLQNYKIEAIPQRIYNLYKKIVKLSKEA